MSTVPFFTPLWSTSESQKKITKKGNIFYDFLRCSRVGCFACYKITSVQAGGRSSLIPFMTCMSARSSSSRSGGQSRSYHAWDVIVKYYTMKGGPEYNSAPARKLSMSFGLDLSAGAGANNRQSLLSAINQIINSHEPYKRSPDAMFKASICTGLKY